MQLTKLEISGFKSFAKKTELIFKNGITGILGPNGCGKSNIADAFRFVLGEQNARALRGKRIDDFIFGGKEKRKPLSYCEVSLVFDNDDHALAMEAAEVMVTRRVYRNGESEYYLNRTACRLKDVVDLFRDTGIGKEGYSIIGQGRIDEILSRKSEDRRQVFEEAAGIVKFKARKEEAKEGFIPLGLLTYPPLMAADILLYQATLVPVGEDQRQHMEITRDLAERFNRKYGEVFTLPEMWAPKGGARVMSLQDPTSKMSKSDDNDMATIHMLDEPDVIAKKIKRAVTDSIGHVHYDKENQPGVSNLMSIHAAISHKSFEEIEAMYEGQGYGVFKKDVADLVVGEMSPILARYKELMGTPELDAILDEGREKAHARAHKTYEAASRAMGLYR